MSPAIPVDDVSLTLIEEALAASYAVDESGDPVLVGAEHSLTQLLDFWSGHDPSRDELIGETSQGEPIVELGGIHLTHTDVIAALITEVRRLRGGEDASSLQSPCGEG